MKNYSLRASTRNIQKPKITEENKQTKGRWNSTEKSKFLEACKLYGKDWKKIKHYVGTRTLDQIRSHGQKYFPETDEEKIESISVYNQS